MPHIFYSIVTTNRGDCGLIWSRTAGKAEQLLRLYPAYRGGKTLHRGIRMDYPGAKCVDDDPSSLPNWLRPLEKFLTAYYAGDVKSTVQTQPDWLWLKEHLDWSGQTGFSSKVLQAAFRIKSGATISYGQLARRIKRPRAARAVGGALARNPWPVLIPCHRVIGSDGSMTGFSGYGDVSAKQWMLDMEKPNA